MKLNTKETAPKIYTHEGAKASRINAELQLRRSVLSCMLWEDSFYESGEDISKRIASLIPEVKPQVVMDIAIEARTEQKLRHGPLFIAREMARTEPHKARVAETLEKVIQRPDELTEFLAIYWKDGKCPLSAQVKRGLAAAFQKFDEYALAKYNRDAPIKLRDVLFLCHAKPKDKEQAKLWKRLVDKQLEVPNTWEVALSGGEDKKAAFTRLLKENQLGALALLRNLRNMTEAGVSEKLIKEGIVSMKTERVLPFRFITAARYAPGLESELEQAMFKCLEVHPKMEGKTILLVDVSGSMDNKISDKSELMRMDAACGLAMLLREIADTEVFTFSNSIVRIPSRRGFALRDAIVNSQSHSSTHLGAALTTLNYGQNADRIIVLTDEQSHDSVSDPKCKGYVCNVACNQNGVGYGKWTHLDGWSEALLDYIVGFEQLAQ